MSNLPQNITKALDQNTELLNTQAERLLDTLYPYYRVNVSHIPKLLEQDAATTLDCFTFYRIASCTIEEIEDEFSRHEQD